MHVDRDAIGQRIAVAPAALGQRRALIEAEQRVAGLHLDLLENVRRRLVFDDDGDVLHLGAKAPRDVAQGLFDETGEVLAGHISFCRGAPPPDLSLAAPPLRGPPAIRFQGDSRWTLALTRGSLVSARGGFAASLRARRPRLSLPRRDDAHAAR